MNRKPIQVSTAMAQAGSFFARTVVVICDDGSIWRMTDSEDGIDRWVQLPRLPEGFQRQ